MHVAAIDLEEAMIVAMVSFSFPVRMLVIRLYARYTERSISFSIDEFVDLILAGCVALWFERFVEYSLFRKADESIATTPEEIFMYNVIQDIQTEEFHFDFLLALVAGLFWLRVLFMLKLTKTFGPMIKII